MSIMSASSPLGTVRSSMDDKIKQNLLNLLQNKARQIVGILCKRIEILAEEEYRQQKTQPNAKVLTPFLYKSLVKEIIYEQFRELESLVDVAHLPTVQFISKKNK